MKELRRLTIRYIGYLDPFEQIWNKQAKDLFQRLEHLSLTFGEHRKCIIVKMSTKQASACQNFHIHKILESFHFFNLRSLVLHNLPLFLFYNILGSLGVNDSLISINSIKLSIERKAGQIIKRNYYYFLVNTNLQQKQPQFIEQDNLDFFFKSKGLSKFLVSFHLDISGLDQDRTDNILVSISESTFSTLKHLEVLNNKDEFSAESVKPFIFAKNLTSLQSLTFYYLNLKILELFSLTQNMPKLKLIKMNYQRSIIQLWDFLNMNLTHLKGIRLVKIFYNHSDSQVTSVINSKRSNYLVLRGPSFTLVARKLYCQKIIKAK